MPMGFELFIVLTSKGMEINNGEKKSDRETAKRKEAKMVGNNGKTNEQD